MVPSIAGEVAEIEAARIGSWRCYVVFEREGSVKEREIDLGCIYLLE